MDKRAHGNLGERGCYFYITSYKAGYAAGGCCSLKSLSICGGNDLTSSTGLLFVSKTNEECSAILFGHVCGRSSKGYTSKTSFHSCWPQRRMFGNSLCICRRTNVGVAKPALSCMALSASQYNKTNLKGNGKAREAKRRGHAYGSFSLRRRANTSTRRGFANTLRPSPSRPTTQASGWRRNIATSCLPENTSSCRLINICHRAAVLLRNVETFFIIYDSF